MTAATYYPDRPLWPPEPPDVAPCGEDRYSCEQCIYKHDCLDSTAKMEDDQDE